MKIIDRLLGKKTVMLVLNDRPVKWVQESAIMWRIVYADDPFYAKKN